VTATRGIFIIAELPDELAQRVSAVQRINDPRMALVWQPHITLIGSSGSGPILADTPVNEIRQALVPIASGAEPIELRFGPPERFPGRDIVVLPLDPHGPLRALHESLRTAGLRTHRPRYPFTPHCTLTMYPPLSRARERQLLTLSFPEPFTVERLRVVLTRAPQPAKLLLDLPLGRG
jgi:2'-5' RNA ligase